MRSPARGPERTIRKAMQPTLTASLARAHCNWSSMGNPAASPHQPRVEDDGGGLDHRSGTLDSRVVRRSRKPWIGVPVAVCTMAAIPGAGAVTDQGPAP